MKYRSHRERKRNAGSALNLDLDPRWRADTDRKYQVGKNDFQVLYFFVPIRKS